MTRERWQRFKAIKRAYWSFWILGGAFILSLFANFLAGNKPIVMKYEGEISFPVVKFYPETAFGGKEKTEADYKALAETPRFQKEGNWMLMPPIPHAPDRGFLDRPGDAPWSPSSFNWLGSDNEGRDILSRLIHGFRICMTFSLALTVIALFSGIVIGGIQGYFGGKLDIAGQRLTEIWSALPFLYVVIPVGEMIGRDFWTLLLLMSLFQWVGLSYYMRGEFYRIKNATYVKAARALGYSERHIFFREILPNAVTPVVTVLPFSLIGGISALTALDFLGFGLDSQLPSWGRMLKEGLDSVSDAPWIAGSVVVALFITLLLAAFIGEGVREAFDSRQGGRS